MELGNSTLTNCMAFNISNTTSSEIPSIDGILGLLPEKNGKVAMKIRIATVRTKIWRHSVVVYC